MIDKSKRFIREVFPIEGVEHMKGLRLEFDSMAEMITTRCQEIPDKIHCYYYDEVITYRQTNERSNKIGNYLKEKGVVKGDIVSIMILNSPDVWYTTFGAQKLGAIAGGVNYMLKGPEIAYVLEDSKPKVAFVCSEFMAEFARGYQMSAHKPIVVEVETGIPHDTDIAQTTLKAIMDTYPADECLVPQSPDDPFLLLYSSGTTGMPKGILLSNKGEFSICKDMASMGANIAEDVMMILLPMFHTNPLCVWTYPYSYQGISFVIRRIFSPDEFWPSCTRYGVTIVMGVPAMYQYIVNSVDPSTIEMDKVKLRYAFSGAAPMPLDIVQSFKDKFGVRVIDGYGLTEVCGVSTSGYGTPENWAAVGTAYASQEIEIMDDDNNILPYGEKGEICMKGDAVMIGYLNKPEATAETVKDGWLHTGDMGWMDEQGFLYISGRKKEMINRGGENIYPREIEIPLEKHPKILEVAVIGAPDTALGERVRACIALNPGESMTAQEVKDYLSDKIAKYKVPEFVEFVAELPKNPSGKVLKQDLKKMYSD
ncbi:MAG: acyl--CoA ligase [Syntrophomonadaceae bacterium]|nr:acyl--CoA ligase [Syntrophomonadaceae bacterium]